MNQSGFHDLCHVRVLLPLLDLNVLSIAVAIRFSIAVAQSTKCQLLHPSRRKKSTWLEITCWSTGLTDG